MKTFLMAMAMTIATVTLHAQSPTIDNFFNAVPESDNVLRLELTGFFLKLAANISDDEDSQIVKGIKAIRLISADNQNDLPGNEVNRLVKGLRSEAFEPLMEIRDGGDNINLMVKDQGDYITDFVAKIQDDEGGFMLLSIEGAFKYEDLQKLDVDFNGIDKVKKATKDLPRA